MNCINLSQIDLSEVIEFGMESFSYCQSLTSLDLASAKVLGAGAFLCASKVATVSIPVLERIEIQALSCIDVTEIALPETLKYIAPTAFYYNAKQVKFTNTSLVYENNTSVLETLVTNKSDKTEYLSEFDILVKDKDGNVIVTLTGFIGASIDAGESRVIASTYSEDLTKAASIEYKIVR